MAKTRTDASFQGPANWSSLDSEANELCASGKRQSPIDILSGSPRIFPAMELALTVPDMARGAMFENLVTTVEVIAMEGTMSFDGVGYALKQFHFYLLSEHLDNGTSIAMEMHMVWENDKGEIAVIGTLIDLSDRCCRRKRHVYPLQ
ncbi:alpha carbonic anhydrase [Dactylonectria macrodidyma]|uniref:carbonic anhydrase n=1 Tax=Dactylonectria macrodidyma TaxID=307937 RepID=A0A9P9CZQ1_9HYPO|nr:alpha carbonic anhydrase [Dactylonectria macrodidyma]